MNISITMTLPPDVEQRLRAENPDLSAAEIIENAGEPRKRTT
jgi:hypothetical protein